jgi:hypothetical protein
LSITLIMLFFQPIIPQVDEVYQFPVRPGTQEWIAMKSYKERVMALQIPENILKEMSTHALVKTCLNYPFRITIRCSNSNVQDGINRLIKEFNGLQELLKRKNAGSELFNVYMQLEPISVKKMGTSYERGSYSFKISFIELFLSQNTILDNLNREQRISILRRASQVIDSKSLLPNVYGARSALDSCLLIGRIMMIDIQEEFIQDIKIENEVREFFESGSVRKNAGQIIGKVMIQTKQFISREENVK